MHNRHADSACIRCEFYVTFQSHKACWKQVVNITWVLSEFICTLLRTISYFMSLNSMLLRLTIDNQICGKPHLTLRCGKPKEHLSKLNFFSFFPDQSFFWPHSINLYLFIHLHFPVHLTTWILPNLFLHKGKVFFWELGKINTFYERVVWLWGQLPLLKVHSWKFKRIYNDQYI